MQLCTYVVSKKDSYTIYQATRVKVLKQLHTHFYQVINVRINITYIHTYMYNVCMYVHTYVLNAVHEVKVITVVLCTCAHTYHA